jgi:hypothetical protein
MLYRFLIGLIQQQQYWALKCGIGKGEFSSIFFISIHLKGELLTIRVDTSTMISGEKVGASKG